MGISGYAYSLRLGFLSYAKIGSKDLSPNPCNVNMFYVAQCSHQVWNLSLYLNPSTAMCLSHNGKAIPVWFMNKV